MPTRLDKLLASRGYCSRSEVRMFLRQHVVALDGNRLGREEQKLDADAESRLRIDHEPIDPATLLVMLHKPLGHTCSHKEDGPLVYDLLPWRWMQRNPLPATVGRLDKETTGLLLITDDGQLIHRLTSPKKHVPRVYRATLQHPLRGEEAERFASGVLKLEGEDKPLLPVETETLSPTSMRLTLHEGRYHQVRRMFAAVGNHVVALHRERFGSLELGDLEPGAWRAVTMADVGVTA